jgi:hypothetical protein
MNASLSLAEAVELYDCLVEELSSAADGHAPNTAISTLDRCCQLHRLCRLLLEVHTTIDPILSNSQQEAIQSTLDQVRRSLRSDNDDDDDDCLHVNWDRATLRMKWWEETNLMCGWDKNQLQHEEDMLLAMASTPIPHDEASVRTDKKRLFDNSLQEDDEC